MHAYELYESSVNQDPLVDWTQAKSAVFKQVLMAGAVHRKE